MKRLSVCLILLMVSLSVFALEIRLNENAIYTDAPRLVKEAPGGRLEIVGDGDDSFHVLHLWGTPYQMGKMMGTMLQEQIQQYCDLVIGLMATQMGGDASMMDKTYEAAREFIPAHFMEEMKGLADGADIDLKTVIRVNMIGEVSEWHCSLFAAWGKATASTGALLQLRALDYAVEAEIQRYPVVVVYHPEQGHPFANFTWCGIVGAVTGMSSAPLAISEIGDDYHKESDTFAGYPFMFMLRDILQFDRSMDEAIARIRRGPRTSSLMYAVGDGELGEGRGFQTSRKVCNVFNDENLEPLTPAHQRIEDVVYWGMSWNVPKYDKALHDMLKKHYGKITAEITIREILPTVGTGNLQTAIYDLTNNIAWIANARANAESGPRNAYERSFVRLDMKQLFTQTAP